jgi:hypothetical protein
MSEQLAFQESLRDGSAIDCKERRLTPSTMMIDGPGDEFLVSSTLTEHQNVDGLGSNLSDAFADRLNDPTAPYNSRSSWATPAASSPTAANRSDWMISNSALSSSRPIFCICSMTFSLTKVALPARRKPTQS